MIHFQSIQQRKIPTPSAICQMKNVLSVRYKEEGQDNLSFQSKRFFFN